MSRPHPRRMHNHILPQPVRALWAHLDGMGETLLVGGYVRDAVIGVDNADGDFDFATILEPDAVAAILQPLGYQVIPTGVDYGTVTVLVDGGHKVEVTRSEEHTSE